MMDFEALARWYAVHGARYPWRKTKDPYRVMLTEIMLQRTRADIVAKMFPTFFGRYPTQRVLAKASSREIAELMMPLGLTHRIPRVIDLITVLSKMNAIPNDREALLNLPGIGPYIADAILCYSYGVPTIPIDVNIRRLLARYSGESATEEHARKVLRSFLNRRQRNPDVKKLNWALLDLAKVVCKPKTPSCRECPLESGCRHARIRH